MRVRVEQTSLPGIGVRHDFVSESGQRLGVVSHRDGRRALIVYDRDDPDARLAAIPLTDDEAAEIIDSSLIPDVRASMPGRGAWVHATSECVDAAIRRCAFVRALRASGPLDTQTFQTTHQRNG